MGQVSTCIGGEVDVPLILEEMNFRRPDFMCVWPIRGRRPNNLFLCVLEIDWIASLPQSQVFAGGVHVVVDAILIRNPRIWSGRQQRISESPGGCLPFLSRELRVRAEDRSYAAENN